MNIGKWILASVLVMKLCFLSEIRELLYSGDVFGLLDLLGRMICAFPLAQLEGSIWTSSYISKEILH